MATRTIAELTRQTLSRSLSLWLLATWECLIGLGLLTGRHLMATLILLFIQMIGTLTPLMLFPHETFSRFPYALTLEGQYIVKNIVLISAGLVIAAHQYQRAKTPL